METTVARTSPWLRSAWLRPLNDTAALDDLLGLLNPAWSLTELRARVVAVVDETADTRSFVLAPNRHWRGFAAGQYLPVFFEIKGRREQRCYSLSSAPGAETLRITVKRQPGGRVSNALHEQLQVGQVLSLGQAAGDFVLPFDLPTKLLLLGAGSGVTPLMAQLLQLRAQGYAGQIRFIQVCRTPADAIFRAELEALAAGWPQLQLEFHSTAEAGRLTPDALVQRVPDYAERHTLLCGPSAFMAAVRARWASEGLSGRLQTEAFAFELPAAPADGMAAEVRCAKAEQVFTAEPGQTLLAQAEAAGLNPRHGCRIGICHACKCVKRSGRVQNLLTGEISDAPDEAIQLCISAARSDLVLDL